MGNERWRVIATLSYCAPEPVYIDVGTDYNKCENLLRNGQLLVEKGNYRLIVTVDINLQWRNSVQVEGLASMKKEVDKFIDGVKDIIEGKNFYRGKNIEFGRRLRFLNLRAKSWDSIILDPGIKREIKANTIDFLNKRELWGKYGIPSKRGILLAGEPGTGKTAICKALMAEASGITCITTNAYGLDDDDYITELYELAQDLSPCIVFIEDIDLVGQNREEFGYHKGSALLSLLTVLDGIEERKEIVTVATTNCVDMLDKAISERPSRFDRVIRLARPSLEQRQELINLLGQKISMDEPTQDYIARNTEYCTPAQLQEVIYGLVIEHCDESSAAQSQYLTFSADDIDSVISKINGKHKHQIGFSIAGKHNGDKGSIYEP
jgi:cell division protease FtsH